MFVLGARRDEVVWRDWLASPPTLAGCGLGLPLISTNKLEAFG